MCNILLSLIKAKLTALASFEDRGADRLGINHYDDVIMTMLASQITSLTVVYSIVYSGVIQRKHQSSASLAFVREIHRGPVNFPHKWPVTRKMFPFDDVIMYASLRQDKPTSYIQEFCYTCVYNWGFVVKINWFCPSSHRILTLISSEKTVLYHLDPRY